MKRPEETEAYWEQYKIDARTTVASHFQFQTESALKALDKIDTSSPNWKNQLAGLIAGKEIVTYFRGYRDGIASLTEHIENAMDQAAILHEAAVEVVEELTGQPATSYFDIDEAPEEEEDCNE